MENNLIFRNEKYSLLVGKIFIEKGEDALFSEFNTDFLNYDVDEGYKEEFPFGSKSIMSGLILELNINKFDNINFNTKASYFFDTFLDNSGLNLSASISYIYDLKI